MCKCVERMVLLLLQVTLCANMLSGWFCCCCRRLTVAGSALRCSRISWRTVQSARGRAAAYVSRWSRGVPSSCRGTVFLPTPHSTPASPPFCASVGGTLILSAFRDKTSSILSLTCSLVRGTVLSDGYSTCILRVKECRARNLFGYIGRLKRRWSLGSAGDEKTRINRDQ
jgi:hypothetical protein